MACTNEGKELNVQAGQAGPQGAAVAPAESSDTADPSFHPGHGHALPLSGDRQAQGAPILSQPPPQVSDLQTPEAAPLPAPRDQH